MFGIECLEWGNRPEPERIRWKVVVMSGFILRAVCHGHRPAHLSGVRYYQRSSLVSQLLRERGVSRFIVAPPGYGKTSLAMDYAETMMSFANVIWINGQSPCFVRDLDEGALAASCQEADRSVRLVVFDDLPHLDAARSERFSHEIDELLQSDCEVIVTCVPANDTFGILQRDRLKVNARDLLLNDYELDLARTSDERAQVPSSEVSPAYRIPALVWGSNDGAASSFVLNSLKGDVPSELLLVMGSVAVLQEGSYDDLLAFGPVDRELLADAVLDYPHLGFDDDLDRFQASPFDVDEIAGALKKRLDLLVERSVFSSKSELVFAWAQALMDAGKPGRACDVVRTVCAREHRAEWVYDNAYDLVRGGCFYPCLRLIDAAWDTAHGFKPRLAMLRAACYHMLGDDVEAAQLAKRYAFSNGEGDDIVLCALLLLARYAPGMLGCRARDELGRYESGFGDGVPDNPPLWPLLAAGWRASCDGAGRLGSYWVSAQEAGACQDGLIILAIWYFDLLAEVAMVPGGTGGAGVQPGNAEIERYVARCLEPADGRLLDYFAISAGLAMERAHAQGLPLEAGCLDASRLLRMRQAEMSVLSQRRRFERGKRDELLQQDTWMATHPEAPSVGRGLSPMKGAHLSVPLLSVKVFGRFEARIGSEEIDPALLKRRNVRLLLALLVSNLGRELLRESVCSSMWPESDSDTARKNFYSVWSKLKKALTLPDGTCPYLVRHQMGCSLDHRYVRSDAARLDDICRELLFGQPDQHAWGELFTELDRDFSSDLMPSECENPLILRARHDYKMRLVDALVSASESSLISGNAQWAVWFARSALSHDHTREDAYAALMRAQVESGQRTAAMSTYLKCRSVLAEELGVDPSPALMALYEDLLEGGNSFKQHPMHEF